MSAGREGAPRPGEEGPPGPGAALHLGITTRDLDLNPALVLPENDSVLLRTLTTSDRSLDMPPVAQPAANHQGGRC